MFAPNLRGEFGEGDVFNYYNALKGGAGSNGGTNVRFYLSVSGRAKNYVE